MEAPTPGEGEVRIKVAYAGINFADLLMRMGFYQPRPAFPFTPGYEASGVIDATGPGVSDFEVGQRVVAAMRNGGQASYVLSSVDRVRSTSRWPVPSSSRIHARYLHDGPSHASPPRPSAS